MNGLLGNIEVVLGVRFKPDTPASMLEFTQWAVNRKLYFDNKQEYHKHNYAWVFHARVGKFAGYHASRVWLNPKTGYWHLSAHFSCNNFTRAVNLFLAAIAEHAMPEGFAGYIIPESEQCPVLVYFFETGLVLQAVSTDSGEMLDKQSFMALEQA